MVGMLFTQYFRIFSKNSWILKTQCFSSFLLLLFCFVFYSRKRILSMKLLKKTEFALFMKLLQKMEDFNFTNKCLTKTYSMDGCITFFASFLSFKSIFLCIIFSASFLSSISLFHLEKLHNCLIMVFLYCCVLPSVNHAI